MSLLWRDQIRVVLCPRQVVLLRFAAGLRGRVTDKRIINCEAATSSEAAWRNALAKLQTALADLDPGKANVFVVLSNHFVRYALIAHSNDIITDEEQDALIRHNFTRRYGDDAEHWQFLLNDRADAGGIRLSCAVDRELPDALDELIQSSGLKLRSVQPYFTAAFNQWRRRLPGTAWFVVVERGRLCLAGLHDNRWHAIKSINIGEDWMRELTAQLHRESFISDTQETQPADDAPVFIFAPGFAEPGVTHIAGHPITLLRHARRRGDEATAAHYAMTMSG